MLTVLLVIAILVLLIVIHEFGHFVVAKIFRVRVEEFGIGYPPRAFTFGTWGKTEYTLNWIPFGGFVRLFGEEGEKKHGRGSFVDANRGVQALILVAGVAANAVAAWALFSVALHTGVPQVVAVPPEGQVVRLLVSNVVPGAPADAGGIVAGDEITGVGDEKGARITDTLTPEAVVAFVRDHAGKPVEISYKHEGVEKESTIIPAQGILTSAAGQPALGIALVLVAHNALPWNEAVVGGFFQTGRAFVIVGNDLWGLMQGALHGALDISQIVGPVGIVSYAGEASQDGWGMVFLLAGMISVNLAIINLIPIPALDGGRLFILFTETLMRRSAPSIVLQALNALSIGLILILMLVVTYQDIGRLFS